MEAFLIKFIKNRKIPGFGLTLGYTLVYLSVLVLLPLAMLVLKASHLTGSQFLAIVLSERALAAYKVTFFASLVSGLVSTLLGVLTAWVLVRYTFITQSFWDAIIDLPFALPTAVAGITLTTLYSQNGWVGRILYPLGYQSAYSFFGICVALVFIGFPFVVRTLQPVIMELEKDVEEAARSLGASSLQIFLKIICPALIPGALTGFALSFGRAIGEYGSVVFISGNIPYKTEIAPMLIMGKLEQFEYEAATAIGVVMLLCSLVIFFSIQYVQVKLQKKWSQGQ